MNKTQVLINQLKTTFNGRAWHGPSLINILENVDYKQAQARPLFERRKRSIWQHRRGHWINVPIMTLVTHEYPEVSFEENWPPMGNTEENWQESKQKLLNAVNTFIIALSKMSNEKYDEIIKGKDYDYMSMLFGALNHNLYHMGQISIMKKKV